MNNVNAQNRGNKIETLFSRAAVVASKQAGRSHSFVVAIMVVVVWAATGPLFSYSDTWQLLINTGTTIATFLMIFLLQNTQNRDTTAIQLKLDELIASSANARNRMLRLEDLTEDELEELRKQFAKLGDK